MNDVVVHDDISDVTEPPPDTGDALKPRPESRIANHSCNHKTFKTAFCHTLRVLRLLQPWEKLTSTNVA